jgi:hypothetical protein
MIEIKLTLRLTRERQLRQDKKIQILRVGSTKNRVRMVEIVVDIANLRGELFSILVYQHSTLGLGETLPGDIRSSSLRRL